VEERSDCGITKGALFSKVIKTSTAYELQKQLGADVYRTSAYI
jgi:hypothetical protein